MPRHTSSTNRPSKYRFIGESTSSSIDFISSVVAGLLLGLALDWLFSTNPVFTIVGVIAGFVSGFVKLWVYSKVLEDQARERGRLG